MFVNLVTSPGTLVVLVLPVAIWLLLKKCGFRNTQFLIVALVVGLVVGPNIMGAFFPAYITAAFPNGTGYVKVFSDIAVVVMGLLAGIHILHGRKHRNAHSGNGRFNGKSLTYLSLITIAAQVILGLLVSEILLLVFPEIGGNHPELFGAALGIIFPVIALPVLTAALIGLGWTETRIGRLSMEMSVNTEIFLWPSLILVTTVGNASNHSNNMGLILAITLGYLLLMFFLIKPVLHHFDQIHAGLGFALTTFIVVASSWTTEQLGLHVLLGAVVAGVISPPSVQNWISRREKVIQYGLTPFFLVGVGLLVRFEFTNWQVWVVTIVLTLTSGLLQTTLVSKLGVFILRLSPENAKALAYLVIMRGMVEIVVSRQLAEAHIITDLVSQSVILMALLQTLVGPVMAKKLYREDQNPLVGSQDEPYSDLTHEVKSY